MTRTSGRSVHGCPAGRGGGAGRPDRGPRLPGLLGGQLGKVVTRRVLDVFRRTRRTTRPGVLSKSSTSQWSNWVGAKFWGSGKESRPLGDAERRGRARARLSIWSI